MTFSSGDLLAFAAASGFEPGVLERVLRLVELLRAINSHPFLRPRLALKGGTALNLFALDVPRLSVDIDLNYVGTGDLEVMLAEREPLERAIQSVCERSDIVVKRIASEHAGGKWRLSYQSVSWGTGTIELDLNFLLRTPLWPVVLRESTAIPGLGPTTFPVLDIHELAAGKLAALFARGASRDLFDARELLRAGALDPAKLRLGFVIYGAANRVDWRTVSASNLSATARDVSQSLMPMLRSDLVPPRKLVGAWAGSLVAECRDLLSSRQALFCKGSSRIATCNHLV